MISEETKKSIRTNTTKVVLNVPNELNGIFKELAQKRGISKSSMIMYSMSWFIDYSKSLDLLPKMIDTLQYMKQEKDS